MDRTTKHWGYTTNDYTPKIIVQGLLMNTGKIQSVGERTQTREGGCYDGTGYSVPIEVQSLWISGLLRKTGVQYF